MKVFPPNASLSGAFALLHRASESPRGHRETPWPIYAAASGRMRKEKGRRKLWPDRYTEEEGGEGCAWWGDGRGKVDLEMEMEMER